MPGIDNVEQLEPLNTLGRGVNWYNYFGKLVIATKDSQIHYLAGSPLD